MPCRVSGEPSLLSSPQGARLEAKKQEAGGSRGSLPVGFLPSSIQYMMF